MPVGQSVPYAPFGRNEGSHRGLLSSIRFVWAGDARSPRRTVAPLIAFSICLAVAVGLRAELQQWDRGAAAEIEQLRILPTGTFLKPALLGYTHVGADLLWLRIVQVIGSETVHAQDYEWLHHALDVVTTVDPHFVLAYDLGGGLLAELAGRVDWSNRLLAKGLAANPDAWRLPFLLGYNHFFHLHDYRRAAEYMAQAARLHGSPAYVQELAARLYVQANDVQAGLVFVKAMLAQTTHPALREALKRRENEVLVERDLNRLEEARQAYVRSTNHTPTSLHDLVNRGFIAAIPREPFGGRYVLDLMTGRIVSTTHPRRLRLYKLADAVAMAGPEAGS